MLKINSVIFPIFFYRMMSVRFVLIPFDRLVTVDTMCTSYLLQMEIEINSPNDYTKNGWVCKHSILSSEMV